MYWELAPHLHEYFMRLKKELLPFNKQDMSLLTLDKEYVKKMLPHREPFLFIDEVTYASVKDNILIAAFNLNHAQKTMAGHFPDYPVFPGVLQVEAVGQAGIILYQLQSGADSEKERVTLSHICGAQFIHEVRPPGEVEVRVQVFEQGFFIYILGQFVKNGLICSIVSIRGLME